MFLAQPVTKAEWWNRRTQHDTDVVGKHKVTTYTGTAQPTINPSAAGMTPVRHCSVTHNRSGVTAKPNTTYTGTAQPTSHRSVAGHSEAVCASAVSPAIIYIEVAEDKTPTPPKWWNTKTHHKPPKWDSTKPTLHLHRSGVTAKLHHTPKW